MNDSGDYIEMVGYPEGPSWGLGGVLPVVGSGPGFVVLNNRPVLQRDLVHHHRFIEDMRLLEEGHPLLRAAAPELARAQHRRAGAGLASRAAPSTRRRSRGCSPWPTPWPSPSRTCGCSRRRASSSITDEVTPLYNFRYFHQILDRELKLVDRYRSVLSLIFVDLDRFKPINDQYGHLRGSRTLREVGFLIRAAVRETDYPARYGGDEFVVILPQTDAAPAAVLREKLRRLIEGHTFLQEEGINARLGVSLGRRHLSDRGRDQGGAHPARRQAHVRGQGRSGRRARGGIGVKFVGTLLYRRSGGRPEVLIVHPAGANTTAARRGASRRASPDPGEDIEAAARRETVEETGVEAGPLHSIGSVDLARSRKRIHGFAGPAPEGRRAALGPEGGRRAKFVPIDRARAMLHPAQVTFLDRLLVDHRPRGRHLGPIVRLTGIVSNEGGMGGEAPHLKESRAAGSSSQLRSLSSPIHVIYPRASCSWASSVSPGTRLA